MPEHEATPSDEPEPPSSDPFPELTAAGDPSLRLVAWLIKNKDFHQLYLRTGIRKPEGKSGAEAKAPFLFLSLLHRLIAWLTRKPDGKSDAEAKTPSYFLPVLLQFDGSQGNLQFAEALHKVYGVPLAYRTESKSNQALRHVSAKLPLTEEIFDGSVASLIKEFNVIRSHKAKRLSLGVPGQPSRKRESLEDIGLNGRIHNGKALTGDGVIVGIIDDGCALAHCDFLKPRQAGVAAESRILYLWDQAGTGDTAAGWTAPADFDGLELDKAAIDSALNLAAHRNGNLVRQDKVYEYLGYKIGNLASHGTHVMDIAAGNGKTLMGSEGVAYGAGIIFVQLPSEAIEGGAVAMSRNILDGVAYIFARAEALKMPAVVNISYGGYDGPHDGTSELERGIDELLSKPDRAVVIAAGNGFEARCHASKTVQRGRSESLRWIVRPEDPTPNDLEIWYEQGSTLRVRLRSPGSVTRPAGWIQLGYTGSIIRTKDGKIVGYIEHLLGDTGNGDNRVVINLRPTESAKVAEDPVNAPAPSGIWTVEIRNMGGAPAGVHAWIWRDDAGRPGNTRRRQSRFHPDDASPNHTIAGWATGNHTISVGAFNTATQEICGYSACGPTRPTGGNQGRPKPDVYAPAEEDVRGRGVLSASSLSARPTRMNGTSASAPQVTGLIALMFEYAQKHAQQAPLSLTADQIRTEIMSGAKAGALKFNRHQIADARVKTKQKDVQADLIASGKIDFITTMTTLLP